MPRQAYRVVGAAAIVSTLLLTLIGLIHYLLPRRGSADEFAAWSTFLVYWYAYWFLWVPLLGYTFWRLLDFRINARFR